MLVRHAGRRGYHRMHHRLLAVHADVRLGSEVPLVALLDLMHLGVARAAGVLGRGGCVDNRRVHDGACADADALRFQVAIHRHQHLAAKIVLFKQVAKAKDRGFVRRGGYAQIHACKAPQNRCRAC